MYTKDQILAYLEENRAELVRIFPECKDYTDDEMFHFFFGVETSTGFVNNFVVYEDKKFFLKPQFGTYDIPSLNDFRRPLSP